MNVVLPAECQVALVLAGGNALGAYQAGVYQALYQAGVEPDWVIGASAGAINGALIAGNAPEQRMARLASFWRPNPSDRRSSDWWATFPETWRRTTEAFGTLLGGRPGMFAPAGSSLFGGHTPAIYDMSPLATTLASLIDFDRLNGGEMRFATTAVDLDSGEDMTFDSRERTIRIEHIRASGALPPAFSAVSVDGRLYVDGGLSANLPLDPVLSRPPSRSTLCIAVDLLPQAGRHPDTLGEVMGRTQDLMFACQSRRTIMRWQERYATEDLLRDQSMTLVHLTYAAQQPEVAGKAMDFSPDSARVRWDAGFLDGTDVIERLSTGGIPIGPNGLKTFRLANQCLL